MTKPQDFKEESVIHRDTPYKADDRFPKGPQCESGVLTVGRVVWTEEAIETSESDQTIMAFAEGVGVVSVETRNLRP
ncbi:MAG: hypothetical protein M3O31_10600 [Acidobacteriota bacterium]|nr:hypothetical protein [Acidobacteriota bacterium]